MPRSFLDSLPSQVIIFLTIAEVAQLVEHMTENHRVPSSSLGLGTVSE